MKSSAIIHSKAVEEIHIKVESLKKTYIPKDGECKDHEGEDYRHLCLDHNLLLCPKCLIKHKQCDFMTANEVFSFETKKRLREVNR